MGDEQRMWRSIAVVLLGGMIALTMACGELDDEDLGSTGLGLWTQTFGEVEVEAVRYRVTRCDAEEIVAERVVSLADKALPSGAIGGLGGIFHPESRRVFADYFVALPVGCYDIYVTPVDAEGKRDKRCLSVVRRGVEVEAGQTREVVLISQCNPPPEQS